MNTAIWEDHAEPAGAPFAGAVRADVCVVGLGGSGLSCIHELLDRGASVVGLDAGAVGGGAAGRNGGILRPGTAAYYHAASSMHGRERARRLYELTCEEIDRMATLDEAGVRRQGMLRLAVSDEDFADCALQRAAMLADGLRAEPYEGPLGRGIFLPDAATMQPLTRCRALARLARERGARLFENSPVRPLGDRPARTDRRDSAVGVIAVRTDGGIVECDRLIIAVDGHLESLVPRLSSAARTARLQMLATAPSATRLPCPVAYDFGFDYAQQLPDGRIAFGGGRNRAMDHEWTHDSAPTEEIQSQLERALRERLHVTERVTHRWAASVSYSANGLPLIREVEPGVWAVGAYCGTGNLLGALAGRAAAQLACGAASEVASLLAS